mmetsp:Transcript_3895/g.6037  ORF Transcript_3895/g.6037 Transcript_3895/m.6037 type:complete len:80 (-) Transcript_3895:326-565(-)
MRRTRGAVGQPPRVLEIFYHGVRLHQKRARSTRSIRLTKPDNTPKHRRHYLEAAWSRASSWAIGVGRSIVEPSTEAFCT